MSVSPVSGTSDLYATMATAPSAASGQSLDKDAFLELLVASLKYQDPSAPMDTSELMAQTTQLSTMEQLVGMAEMAQQSFALQQRSSAAALVGQHVSYFDGEKSVSGLVKSVDLTAEVPLLIVDDVAVPLDLVSGVTTPPTA